MYVLLLKYKKLYKKHFLKRNVIIYRDFAEFCTKSKTLEWGKFDVALLVKYSLFVNGQLLWPLFIFSQFIKKRVMGEGMHTCVHNINDFVREICNEI